MEGGGAGELSKVGGNGVLWKGVGLVNSVRWVGNGVGLFQRCEEMGFLWKGVGLVNSVRCEEMESYGRWWGFSKGVRKWGSYGRGWGWSSNMKFLWMGNNTFH